MHTSLALVVAEAFGIVVGVVGIVAEAVAIVAGVVGIVAKAVGVVAGIVVVVDDDVGGGGGVSAEKEKTKEKHIMHVRCLWWPSELMLYTSW